MTCLLKKFSSKTGGYFASPLFPHKYPLNTECHYLLEGPELYNVYVNFSYFYTEDDRKCGYDYVRFYDGQTTAAPILGQFCGSVRPVPVRSNGRYLLIVFHSDEATVHNGFNATWSVLEPSKSTIYFSTLIMDYSFCVRHAF